LNPDEEISEELVAKKTRSQTYGDAIEQRGENYNSKGDSGPRGTASTLPNLKIAKMNWTGRRHFSVGEAKMIQQFLRV